MLEQKTKCKKRNTTPNFILYKNDILFVFHMWSSEIPIPVKIFDIFFFIIVIFAGHVLLFACMYKCEIHSCEIDENGSNQH